MRIRIPIYQMTFGRDIEGRTGLVFSSEVKTNDMQSILFTFPIIDSINHPIDLIEQINRFSIYFPFDMEGKYYELEAKINFPELIFQIPGIDRKVVFLIDETSYLSWFHFPIRGFYDNKYIYIGEHKKIVPKNKGFILLMPVDLYEMDELFLKYKATFVGLTSNFGNYEAFTPE